MNPRQYGRALSRHSTRGRPGQRLGGLGPEGAFLTAPRPCCCGSGTPRWEGPVTEVRRPCPSGPEERALPPLARGAGPAYSSVSLLLSSMKAMDSDLRRLVTSYVRRVTPKMSSW